MRKLISMLLTVCLLLAGFCFTVQAEEAEAILTAEPWKSTSGTLLTLNADGTAKLVSNTEIDGEWSFSEPNLTFTYELYGTRTLELILEQKDGVWQLHTADGQGLYLPESQAAAAAAAANANLQAYEIPLGTPITLPFATIIFDHAEVTGMVGSNELHHSYNTAAEGTRYMALQGTITNESNIELKAEQVRVEFVFDDNYTYSGSANADVLLDGGKIGVLTPLTTCDYTLYTAIPEALTTSFKTCRVTYALNDDFATTPNYLADGAYVFVTYIDEEASSAAQQGPVRELTYFEESPILPVPTSYADFRESGHSSSKSNGKVTRISYTYRALLDGDSISDLCDVYLEALKEAGYLVEQNGGEYTVSAGGTQLATIKLDGDSMSMSINPGNEGLTEKPSPDGTMAIEQDAGAPEAVRYHLGDTIEAHTAEMVLREMDTTDKIYSDLNGSSSWYHYQESTSGDPLLAVFGEFKNTGTEPVDIFNIYAAFIVDDTYSYRADVTGVKKGADNFIRDVAPMQSTGCYVYGEVPDSAIKGASSIVLKLGFTDNFSIKFTTSGSLPIFDHCDEVFEIKLLGGQVPESADEGIDPMTEYTDKETVKATQQALNDAGYNCGTPDGVAGKNTKKAISSYQSDHGLNATGTVTHELLVSLGLK